MYLFKFKVVLVFAEIQFLEVGSLVNVVAGVYSYLFDNSCAFLGNLRTEMYVGNQWLFISVGFESLLDHS